MALTGEQRPLAHPVSLVTRRTADRHMGPEVHDTPYETPHQHQLLVRLGDMERRVVVLVGGVRWITHELPAHRRGRDEAFVPGEGIEGALLDADAAVEAGAVVDGERVEDLVRTGSRARRKVRYGLGVGAQLNAPGRTFDDADDAARTESSVQGDRGVPARARN